MERKLRVVLMKKLKMILGKGCVQINNTNIQAKSELKTNCTLPPKFILSVHYNGDGSYLFVNNIQQYKFKAKDPEIKTRKLCLGIFQMILLCLILQL